ncbi:MAG: hypothetical protein KG075_07400 [Alphaproteobacteria bacterium]|nr:hypothetical protein [Alphaproteobacteria bacterium]
MLRDMLYPIRDALATAAASGTPMGLPAHLQAAQVLTAVANELEKMEAALASLAGELTPPADALPHVWLRWMGNAFSEQARREGDMYLDQDALAGLALLCHNQASRCIAMARKAGIEIPAPSAVVVAGNSSVVVPMTLARQHTQSPPPPWEPPPGPGAVA